MTPQGPRSGTVDPTEFGKVAMSVVARDSTTDRLWDGQAVDGAPSAQLEVRRGRSWRRVVQAYPHEPPGFERIARRCEAAARRLGCGRATSTSAVLGSSSAVTSIVATLMTDGRTLPAVAYDEDLANRIREVLRAHPDVTEQRAFGGLAFLVAGNMAVAASGQGGLLVRVDPAASDALIAQGTARPMEMRDRKMKGWLRVATADVRTKGQLTSWVTTGVLYTRTLPAKPA